MRMVISIGSNIANPVENVEGAIRDIESRFTVLTRSSLYRTAPVGGPEQSDFINAVVIIDSATTPAEVLKELQILENQYGRTREEHWGPRTLDLDLVSVDGVTSNDPFCLLPHPRAHERSFVLTPWLEADPEAVLAGVGKVADIKVLDQEVVRL